MKSSFILLIFWCWYIVIGIACDKAEHENHISLSVLYTQSIGVRIQSSTALLQYVWMFRRADLSLHEPEYSGSQPLRILWENMAAKALHHAAHRTTASLSFLQPTPPRKPVEMCMWERARARESTATMIYPRTQHLRPANFSHLRSPHKLDFHGASC